jgi:hypothetical protein
LLATIRVRLHPAPAETHPEARLHHYPRSRSCDAPDSPTSL